MKVSIEYTIYIERRIKETVAILFNRPSILEYEFWDSVSFNRSSCFLTGELKVLNIFNKKGFSSTKV